MSEGIRVRCSACEEPHVVVPPMLGQFRAPGGEAGLVDLPETRDKAPVVRERLVEADERGRWKCLECGEINQLLALDLTQGESPAGE